ncbi:DUF547 domain-containing protein [Hyalangium rubrum]|uniref:DUF547 domain-containing protein n=1 Tax=Hyalangium rubrum TaxID=3103134 RepID=A0ABU5H207_9BACT|nr:DUF547 domain-containing protein [Hyalangium sp. s54d21]MDY7227492.1 DUF547 domain-containing protein [Hyalangium sp. s54d21]
MDTPPPRRRRRLLLVVAAFVLPAVLGVGGVFHANGLLPASVPDSEAPFSYARYARVLRHVKPDGDVDFSAIGRERQELDAFVDSLASFSPRSRPELFPKSEDALAYWLNAYHALVLQSLVDEYPYLESVHAPWLGRFFWGRSWPVGGRRLTLWALEHRVLLREFADPRIHLALFRGTRGGPLLDGAPFEPAFLDSQLNDAARRYVGDKRHVRLEGNTLHLSRVFETHQADFLAALPAGRRGSVLQFVWAFLPDTCTDRPGCDTRADLDRVCGVKLDQCQIVYVPEDGALPDAAARPVRTATP